MKDLRENEVVVLDGWMLAGIVAFICIIGFDLAACLIYFGILTP